MPPGLTVLFPSGTRWAIAARLPPSALEAARYRLSDYLQAATAKVVAGNDGMSALLVFSGSREEGDGLAAQLSRLHKAPVYLLDFLVDHPSVREINESCYTEKNVHPADFLESYGVIAPGHEPRAFVPSPVTTTTSTSRRYVLTSNDHAATAGQLRGTAGELTLVMGGVELPRGFKLFARQVHARGKKIDFGLQDDHGRRAKLEVKAWSRKAWERELRSGRPVEPESAIGRMLGQLRAATSTGARVYLAVLDVIGKHLADLRRLLGSHGLDGVTVLTFPERRFEDIFHSLRAGLALPAGITPALADLLVEAHDA